jgi:transcription-repair coupling factor (superfamily II helicase)
VNQDSPLPDSLTGTDTIPAPEPVRTFVIPFDQAMVREALRRERRGGGQSFVVSSRIEDIEPLAERLRELVPELDLVVAHGKLPATELDQVMVDFAAGVGDVLLSTNIIETGLDVPAANTMIVWRPDRFGWRSSTSCAGGSGAAACARPAI